MSQGNLKTMQDMYGAFAKGDLPTVLAGMDPRIEWNEAENFPYADGNPYIGPAAVVEGVFKRLADEWEYWNLDIEEFLDAGEKIVVLGRYKAVNKKNGRGLDAQFAHVWKFRDGKAVAFQQYADTFQAMGAVSDR